MLVQGHKVHMREIVRMDSDQIVKLQLLCGTSEDP